MFAASSPLKAAPVEIRIAYGGIPGIISPLLFIKPEILKHYGKSYTVKSSFIRATSIALQGMASGDFDLCYMSFTALANVIINGGLDMKVISDITSWGSHGHQGLKCIVRANSGNQSDRRISKARCFPSPRREPDSIMRCWPTCERRD